MSLKKAILRLKTSFSCTAVAFCLASIVVRSFGEIVVLRHPLSETDSTRKLTCISEDDGSALIWNYNQRAGVSHNKPNGLTDFKPKNGAKKDIEKCAISNSTRCSVKWEVKESGWKVRNSSDYPMSPVFDYRWEDFSEFVFEEPLYDQKYRYVGKVGKSSGTAVFSVRGSNNIHIFLCFNKNRKNGPCFWIILAGWEGKTSVIRSCEEGRPPDEKPPSISKCKDLTNVEHKAEKIIMEYEWRTFTLKWTEDTKTIQIFRETDRENELFLNVTDDSNHRGSEPDISIRCGRESRVRFHFYAYLRTNKKDTVISTEKFEHDEQNFCVEMLVGLCPECKLKVDLVREQRPDIEVGIISGDEKSMYKGVLTWKLVKLNTTLNTFDQKSVKLEIRTFLNKYNGKGQWAIGDIRMCKSVGSLRESTITIRPEKKSHPVINCQKISYKKSAIVDSLSTEMTNSDTMQTQKSISESVEFCGPSCTSFDEGWSLCNSIGCTCGRGFMGSSCAEKCYNGSYGYNCNANCTDCRDQKCDRFTGSCTIMAPCIIGAAIEKPTVMNVTDKSVRIRQKLELEKGTDVSIRIVIREKSTPNDWSVNLTESETATIYEAYIEDLKPDTIYMAHTDVTVKGKEQNTCRTSLYSIFTTTCSGQPLFVIKPEDTTMTINMRNNIQLCRELKSDNYRLDIYDPRKKIQIDYISNLSFPYTQRNLTPYTEYVVTMYDPGVLFVTTIRTLDSGVRNLRVESKSDSKVTLRWDPPRYTDERVRKYDITLEVNALLGCRDNDKPTPPQNTTLRTVNDTTVSISGLHPYAEYTATVVAYTTKPEKVETKSFETEQRSIPTSVVSNLRLVDGNKTLEWDKPEDCTTITGPIRFTELLFAGVSESVRNWTRKKLKGYTYIHLHTLSLEDFTWYNVRAYVSRDNGRPVNSTEYQMVEWRTPPAAPPAVTNLETFDADSENKTVSLRWKPPNPARGEIESYEVIIIQGNQQLYSKTIKVSEEEPECRLWGDYVCVEGLTLPSTISFVRINVYAMNKGVADRGINKHLPINPDVYEKAPSGPKNLTWTPQGHGIVKLEWSYPEITPTKLKLFYVHVNLISSNLSEYKTDKFPITKKCPATQNQKEYTAILYLSTSTVYNVSIVAANQLNFNSTKIKTNITVPGDVVFKGEERLQVTQNGKLLEIRVPTVVNATLYTTVSVIVKGILTCVQNPSSTSSPSQTLTKWIALVYKEHERRDELLKIGTNEFQGAESTCSLHPGETYTILLEVTDSSTGVWGNLMSSRFTLINDEATQNRHLAWLAIPLVLAICLLVLFIRYRKRNGIRKTPREPSYLEIIPSSSHRSSLNNSTALGDRRSLITQTGEAEIQLSAIYEIPNDPDSCTVSSEYFEEYAKGAAASGRLYSQFMLLPRGLTKPCDYGSLPENMPKNRYRNLIAYDRTRVVLEKIPGDFFSDYINASYIKGYRKERAYIAAQGPKSNTVNDFWRMIWQEDVRVICMLVNVVEGVRTMCEKYWPDFGTRVKHGEFLISNVSNQVFADYTLRKFKLSYQQDTREVTHLHYTGWPILGIPSSQSLVAYMKKLIQTPSGNGPVVVHCDTGDGRTGTVILCDICLRQAIGEKIIDVTAVITRMRDSRANMVATPQQYLLAHVIISESMVSTPTQIPCTGILSEGIKKMRLRLPADLQRLNDTMWQEEALDSYATMEPLDELLLESAAADNSDVSRKLERKSNQINAVSVDGVRTKNQYLASELPPPLTLCIFWKFIAEENIKLIIILQCSDLKSPTCCDILPDERILLSMPHIQIETETSHNDGEYFTTEKLLLTDTSEENARRQSLTVLTCKGWKHGVNRKPPTPAALVSLWRASEKISREVGETLVLCHDGIKGCGLYLALSYVLEGMAVDRECDVITAVRVVRRSIPGFVQSKEQCEYLYDAAETYAEYFQCYANFN